MFSSSGNGVTLRTGRQSCSPVSQAEDDRGFYTSAARRFRQPLLFISSLLNLTALQANTVATVHSIYVPAEAICLQLVSNDTQFLGNHSSYSPCSKQTFIFSQCKRTAFTTADDQPYCLKSHHLRLPPEMSTLVQIYL